MGGMFTEPITLEEQIEDQRSKIRILMKKSSTTPQMKEHLKDWSKNYESLEENRVLLELRVATKPIMQGMDVLVKQVDGEHECLAITERIKEKVLDDIKVPEIRILPSVPKNNFAHSEENNKICA